MKLISFLLLSMLITIFSYLDNTYYILVIASNVFSFFALGLIIINTIYLSKGNEEEINKILDTIEISKTIKNKLYKIFSLIFLVIGFISTIGFSLVATDFLISILWILIFVLFTINYLKLRVLKKQYFENKDKGLIENSKDNK